MITLDGKQLTNEEQIILDLAAVRSIPQAAEFWSDELQEADSYEEHCDKIGRTAYKIGLGIIKARRRLEEDATE